MVSAGSAGQGGTRRLTLGPHGPSWDESHHNWAEGIALRMLRSVVVVGLGLDELRWGGMWTRLSRDRLVTSLRAGARGGEFG